MALNSSSAIGARKNMGASRMLELETEHDN